MVDEEKVIYLGNLISKEGFRVYIYAADGHRKLVNSYEEFMDCMESGEWFPSMADIPTKKISKKPEK